MSSGALARAFGSGTGIVVNACQICGGHDLRSVLFLGYLPPVNDMRTIGERPRVEQAFPAELLRCPSCHLYQLGLVVDPNILFPPTYPYTSGTTRILRENFADLARECGGLISLDSGSLVVDVGSNDGTLLANFLERGHRVLGIEPTDRGDQAVARGIPTIKSFFSHDSAAQVRREYGHARVVAATNVFAHIEDPNAVVEAILTMLEVDGLFISESHYLLGLVETVQYDTIYHEHLRYYSLHALVNLLGRHGLDVVKVTRIPTHGGSIRVYAARKGQHAVDGSVAALLDEERAAGLTGGDLASFRERVVQSKLDLYRLLSEVRARGDRIYGVGAPSRASTLINYVGLDDGILDCVLEVSNSQKVGKYIPGTLIPVLDEARLFEDQPPFALLLSWHIADELIANLRRKGFRGRFIVPLPTPRIVD